MGAGCKPPPEPSKLVARADLEFGPSAFGETRVRKVVLANEGGAPLTVLGATAIGDSVEVSPFEPFELEAGAARELEVRFTPDKEGVVLGALEVRSDANNLGPEGALLLKVSGQGVNALVRVETESIDFGIGVLGEARELALQVRNPTLLDSPVGLDFDGADADQFTSPEAKTPLMLKPGEVRELPVRFEPKRLGEVRAVARVTVCSGCAPVDVPLSGNGRDGWLEVTPSQVDFGRVTRGALAEARITLRNLGSKPMAYGGVRLLDNTSGAFRVVSAPPETPGVLAAGAVAELRVAFSPTTAGPVGEARLELDVRPVGTTKPGPEVPLRGEGIHTCVVLQPESLDFGAVAEGMSATRDVQVLNRCRDEVLLSDVKLTTKKGGYFLVVTSPSSLPIPSGQSATLPITFMPRAGVGAGEAELSVKLLNGASSSTEVAKVVGTGKVFTPCQYQLEPAVVEFGNVPVGSEVTLGASVRNTGTSECFLTGVQVAEGSDDAFKADALGSRVLMAGQRARLLVRFKPGAEGAFSGMAEGRVNHPSSGHVLVPMRGQGVQGCFSVHPTTLDFGTVRLACGPREREVIVYNMCSGPTTLMGLGLEGDAAGFELEHGFLFPAVLAAHSQFRMKVNYASSSGGDHAAALRFDLGTGTPYTVGMVGRAVLENERTDELLQHSQDKVDVLFVVDNSGSMLDEQQSLGANFSALFGPAFPQGVDYRIAVTSTGLETSSGGWAICPGGAEGGENGRFFPIDNSAPRIITPTTPVAESVFAHNTNVGVCHWNEQGLEAMYLALSEPLVSSADDPRTPRPMDGNAGFLREDARLAVIVVTDEEDFSLQPVSAYETFLRGLKGGDLSQVIFSAIVGPEDLGTCLSASSSGTRYIQLARATGGVVESICTPNWAASLERISERTFGPNRTFRLSEPPADSSRILVRVNGMEVKTGWTYDPATNAVSFEQGAAPAPGDTVQVTYPVGC
ncbi:choice-of-anchor D domain-containing protein [Archangium gephyra]|uniref:choice-of-anchor D domain-containing protein n=1 Tax=Archangium gephyra TaxID=48 RepID=UPI0035D4B19B